MLECASWIGMTQSLFAAILICTKKNASIPDKILSGWLYLMAVVFLSTALYFKIFNSSMLSASFLLFNPVIYLYICSLTNRKFSLRPIHLVHLLPFLLFEILAFILHEPFQPSVLLSAGPNFFYRISFVIVNLLSWTVYIPMSIYIVHRHRMFLKNEISNIEKNETLGWLLFITIFYVLYCSATFILCVTEVFSPLDAFVPQTSNITILLLLVYIISFYGLRQNELTKLFNPQAAACRDTYKNSLLSTEQRNIIKEKIVGYFEQQRPYLDPELNMEALSSAINIPKYQITEVLNRDLGKNFFQWVNHYRVEAVKRILSGKSFRYSIEATGYECGFSSKSSFYNFFKSETGMTPREYRDKFEKNSQKP